MIISDRTPWRDLEEKQIGWDMALEESSKWIDILNYCIGLDDMNYSKISSKARSYASDWLSNPQIVEATLRVLEHSLKIDELKDDKVL